MKELILVVPQTGPLIDFQACLFDWAIGSLFHHLFDGFFMSLFIVFLGFDVHKCVYLTIYSLKGNKWNLNITKQSLDCGNNKDAVLENGRIC